MDARPLGTADWVAECDVLIAGSGGGGKCTSTSASETTSKVVCGASRKSQVAVLPKWSTAWCRREGAGVAVIAAESTRWPMRSVRGERCIMCAARSTLAA